MTISRSLPTDHGYDQFIRPSYTAAAYVVGSLVIRHRYFTRIGTPKRRRQRKSVLQVYRELGPSTFRKAYRMSYASFQLLCEKLRMPILSLTRKNGRNSETRHAHNGLIHHTVRVACAVRIFSGGSLYDLATTYGIGLSDVRKSLWTVVEAINCHPDFQIVYPSDHAAQRQIAAEFQEKSYANFGCCAGAIDGLLVWTQKPTVNDCIEAECDSGKFMCGRKHKFGMNLQGVCDCRGRFLDISILFPASSSDCLAFEGSTLFHRLEEGMLADDLCLFGDNAYLNSSFMATPYVNTSSGERDAYNFYFSQLRIRIECAFGMFVHRWSLLRSPMPATQPIARTVGMVLAMARLHNFCIDYGESNMISRLATDELRSELNGAILLTTNTDGEIVADELTGGGHHFHDLPRTLRRRQPQNNNNWLPRERMCAEVADQGLTRPQPQPRQVENRQSI